MRIIFIGQVDFSYHCLSELLNRREHIVAVISRKMAKLSSDDKDLAPLATQYQVPFYSIDNINSKETIQIIKDSKPDVIFCFGWHQIIKPDVLKLAPLGVIGCHPTRLPENRGRHPIIWALVLGLKQSALTFFKMNNAPDAGDIISQKLFMITSTDTAQSIYAKVKRLASQQLKEFVPQLKKGRTRWLKQKKISNVWRKRDVRDGIIDWRMTMQGIYDLVRALSHPYPGALCLYEGKYVTVTKVKKVKINLRNIEPGKVLTRTERTMTVKCYDGAVELLEHGFHKRPLKGEYLR